MKSLLRAKAIATFVVKGLVIVCLFGCTGKTESKPEEPSYSQPNILLISLDACRADHLGCYGYSRDTSPFIDKMAADGTLFLNAFVNTHGTAPSHTTMLTSLYQEVHGISLVHPKPGKTDRIPASALMVQEILRGHGYVTIGVTGGGFMGSALAFDRGFVKLDDRPARLPTQTRRLLKLVNRYHDSQRPMFALLHTYEIHSPYRAPPEYGDLFDTYASDVEPTSQNLLAAVHSADRDLTADDLEHIKAQYDAEIRYTDDTLRDLFAELKESRFLENALVIITADHGEEFADHGGLLHRGLLFDELVHVPLVIWRPGSAPGGVDDQLVSSIDIAPTILAAAGVAIPPEMQGRSLLSRDEASSPSDREAVFMQYGNQRYGIRTRQWKLIETVKSGRIELFDLARDPSEQNNVASASEAVVSELVKRLHDWRVRQSGRTVVPTTTGFSQEEQRQLEALGYVEGRNPGPPPATDADRP